ncbi:hypothetical protein CIB48_g6024 [Xylaria polymorpha]|nr:hypothetical protein CIB48_g6024 [Xylaria polymorpha]
MFKRSPNDMKHPKPFAYRPDDDVRPSLQPRAYRARELLNCTVASFYELTGDKLTAHQIQAKRNFIELFGRQAKIPFKDLDESDSGLYDTLTTLMGYLDEFFFFGSLTHGEPPVIRRLELTKFPPEMDVLGRCKPIEDENGRPEFVISLEKSYHGHQTNLPEFVATLVHEMTHAFLGAFTCDCPKCHRNDINAVGAEFSGHGPTFRGLDYAAMVSMATWSADLDDVFKVRSKSTYITTSSLSREKVNIEDAKQTGRLTQIRMLPYVKNPSNRLLIRVSEDSIFIDVKRLRENVRSTAAVVGKASSRPTRTRKEIKRESSSTEEQSLGMGLPTRYLTSWNTTNRDKKNSSAPLPDEDSEMMDWEAEEPKSKCIYCTAGACKLPVMKGEHKRLGSSARMS